MHQNPVWIKDISRDATAATFHFIETFRAQTRCTELANDFAVFLCVKSFEDEQFLQLNDRSFHACDLADGHDATGPIRKTLCLNDEVYG